MRKGFYAVFFALLLAGVSQGATTLTDSGTTVEPITSLDQIEQVVRDTQWQFWQVVPPSAEDPFYLHPERMVRVVDWNSKDWPRTFLKRGRGQSYEMMFSGDFSPTNPPPRGAAGSGGSEESDS